ncbi:hypothetical protein ACJX0J_028266 [Zea mays]
MQWMIYIGCIAGIINLMNVDIIYCTHVISLTAFINSIVEKIINRDQPFSLPLILLYMIRASFLHFDLLCCQIGKKEYGAVVVFFFKDIIAEAYNTLGLCYFDESPSDNEYSKRFFFGIELINVTVMIQYSKRLCHLQEKGHGIN